MTESSPVRIRIAAPDDFPIAERIEAASDVLLVERFGAEEWPPAATADERASQPGFALVAEVVEEAADSPEVVGFVHVLEIDGYAHLEQLSVLPEHGRHGYGRKLIAEALEEARRRGHHHVTLRTYADVPWNAAFYERCGFVETEPHTPLHRRLVAVEEDLGLMAHGRRVQMTAAL